MALIADRMGNGAPPAEEAAPPVGSPPATKVGGAPPDSEDDTPNVGEEEQALYDSVVLNAEKVIYSDETADRIIQLISSAPQPTEGVAQALVMIMSKIYDQSKQQRQELSEDVLFAAAEEVTGMLFELATEAGLMGEATDEDFFAAFSRGIELWSETHPEMMDSEGMGQDFQNLPPEAMQQVIEAMGAGAGGMQQ